MTIRGRVTLWYVAVLLVSLFLTGGGLYYELVYEPASARQKGQPLDPMESEVGEILLYFIVPAMIVTVVGGWWVLQRSLAPLDQLTVAAERIGADNLHESLPRTFNGDEVDRLSQVLNAMNQRLSDAMKQIHEFTLHASHELKTPLTILHSEIETALGTWPTTPGQRESLASQLDEIQRLSRIVEGLGLLARTNSGQMPFAQDPVPFHEIVHDTAEDTTILARSKQINVEIQAVEEAVVLGDRHRLRQMLLNLAENASKYNSTGGSITISAQATPTNVIFEIANTGTGIRQADLPHLFKKFYRGVAESSGNPGGVGLGLSIAQSIAKAHHGEVNIETARAGWTTVRVILPRIAPALG